MFLAILLTSLIGPQSAQAQIREVSHFKVSRGPDATLAVKQEPVKSEAIFGIRLTGESATRVLMDQFRAVGIDVGNSQNIKILIPASACAFKHNYLFICTTNQMTRDQFSRLEFRVYDRDINQPALVLSGANIKQPDFNMSVFTHRQMTTILEPSGSSYDVMTVNFYLRMSVSSLAVSGDFYAEALGMN